MTETADSDGFVDIFDPSESASNQGGDRTPATETAKADSVERTNDTQSLNGEGNNDRKQADNVPATKSDSKTEGDKSKEKFGNRYEQRKQEMQAIRDEIKAEREALSRLRTQNATQNGQPVNGQKQADPEFVPKPIAPKYSKEDLTKWYNEANEKGDQVAMNACAAELRAWEKHDIDLKFWNIENGQQLKSFASKWEASWNRAVTKFPELKDKNSEMFKEAEKLASTFPEVMNRKQADGQYLIAQLAAMRMRIKNHDSVVGTLEEKNKKLTEQLEAYQKRSQPASQGTKPNLAKPGSGGTPEERLAAKILG